MHNPRSPTRAKSSQVPSLPPLVAPWQQEQTTPNRPHLKPHTSPCQPGSPPDRVTTSFSSSDLHHSAAELERGGGATERLKDLESRIAGLEQANLLENLAKNQTGEDQGRERGGRELQGSESLLSEMTTLLKRLEQRVSQNEQRMLREEAQVTTLVQSMQETERKMLEVQRQLTARREEQGVRLEGLGERLIQLEQRQLQLANFSQQAQEGVAVQLGRVGEEMKTLRSHVKALSSSVGGKMNALDHRHGVLEGTLQGFSGAIVGLKDANAELKKQLDLGLSEVKTGLSEVEGQLAAVGRDREKQDTQLRESFLGVQAELGRTAAHLREQFLDQLEENSTETVTRVLKFQDQVLDAMEYGRRECLRERESLKQQLESRITATEEATEAGKKESEAHLKDLHSAAAADCDRARADLIRETKAKLEEEEERRKVLQGVVSVVEQEAKVARQELLSVMEAEIRTRGGEVDKIREELQKLSRDFQTHSQSARASLEALEQRATVDREQVQLLQDSLVGQWQEVGVRLLTDIDSRLSAVHTHMTSLPHHHPLPAATPPSLHHDPTESSPTGEGHFSSHLTLQEESAGLTQRPTIETPPSQASYLIEDDDDRSEEGGRVTLTKPTAEGWPQHQLLTTHTHGSSSSSSDNPLHSKSRILQNLPHHGPSHDRGRHGIELSSVAEGEESATPSEAEREERLPGERSTTPTSQVGSEAMEERVGDEAEVRSEDMDVCRTPAASDRTGHVATEPLASGDDEFGKSGSELNSSTFSSCGHVPASPPTSAPPDQQPSHSPTELPEYYDPSGEEKTREWSDGKLQSLPSHCSEEEDGEGEVQERSWSNTEEGEDVEQGEGEGEYDTENGKGTKVLWTIGDPHTSN